MSDRVEEAKARDMDDQKCDQKASGEMAKDKHSTERNGTDTKHMEDEVGAPFGTAHPFRYGFCGLLKWLLRAQRPAALFTSRSGWTSDAGFRVSGPAIAAAGRLLAGECEKVGIQVSVRV